jgi:hypothetical protein
MRFAAQADALRMAQEFFYRQTIMSKAKRVKA